VKAPTETRRVATNSGWLIAEQTVRIGGALLIGVWIARHLGPEQYGVLNFALAFCALFAAVGPLGLNRIVVRELVEHQLDLSWQGRLMATVLAMRLANAGVLFCLSVGASVVLGQSNPVFIGIISLGFFFSVCDSLELVFQAHTASRGVAIARSLAFLLSAGTKIALLVAQADLIAFVVMALVDVMLNAVATVLTYVNRFGALVLRRFDRPLAAKLLGESWIEIAAGFSAMLFMRMDLLLLGNLADPVTVGTFSAAARLSEAWYLVPSAIVASAFPAIVRARDDNPAIYWRRMQRTLRFLAALSYGAIAVTLLGAPFVVPQLLGQAYAESVTVLQIHIWCGLFVSFSLVSGIWLMAERKAIVNFHRNIVGAALSAVLNWVLIPRYGASGAAVATLASFAVAYFLFDFIHPQLRAMARAKLRALALLP
jgi:PST family polysaccharide transporter